MLYHKFQILTVYSAGGQILVPRRVKFFESSSKIRQSNIIELRLMILMSELLSDLLPNCNRPTLTGLMIIIGSVLSIQTVFVQEVIIEPSLSDIIYGFYSNKRVPIISYKTTREEQSRKFEGKIEQNQYQLILTFFTIRHWRTTDNIFFVL